jgi:glycosyltransferase involved in cell wall biosynthesis
VDVRLMTSRFLYDQEVHSSHVDYFFFKPLEKWATLFRQRGRLRRLARLMVYPFDLYRLWREFQRQPPDILHVQWMLLPGLASIVLRQMSKKVPLILTVHNPLPRAERFARFTDVQALFSIADYFIVHAEQNRESLLQRAAINPAKIGVVPLGPSLQNQAETSQGDARDRLRLSEQKQVILFHGLIKPYKGLLDLIEALVLLRPRYPNVHLLIAGRCEGDETPYLEAIAAHNLENVTTTHFQFIASADVPMYFAASDVVCFPYRDASQSAALLTAYRFAKPVVVTNVGGLPETVEEGKNGFVVPSRNPAALAEALGKLLDDATLREQFGARSYELSQTRFGWGRAAELTSAIYEKVLDERKRS